MMLALLAVLQVGFSNEFMDRKDGWPALRRAYGLPQRNARGLDHDLAYRALADGAIDATDIYTTDAEIAAYDLTVVEDVRHFFPEYEAVLLWRKDVPDAATAALRRIEGRISAREMIEMNARVKLRHEPEARV